MASIIFETEFLNVRTSDQDLELLKAELARRVQEIDNQRKQMTIMAEKWGHEARKIQESHTMERKELEEVGTRFVLNID